METLGDKSATVTWTHQLGIARYVIHFRRVGTEPWRTENVGNFEAVNNAKEITDRLMCGAIRYEFQMVAFGDGVSYRREEGPPTASEFIDTGACVPVVQPPTETGTPPGGYDDFSELNDDDWEACDLWRRLAKPTVYSSGWVYSDDMKHRVKAGFYTRESRALIQFAGRKRCIVGTVRAESPAGAESAYWNIKVHEIRKQFDQDLADENTFNPFTLYQLYTEPTPELQPIGGVKRIGANDCARCTGGESRTLRPYYVSPVHLKQQVIYGVAEYEASNPGETTSVKVKGKARGEIQRVALSHTTVSAWSAEANQDLGILPQWLWEAILRWLANPNKF